jgi:hypothetical protein
MDRALNHSTAFLRAVSLAFEPFAAVRLEEARCRSWTSDNFRGTRQELIFRFDGPGAGEAADAFTARLDETPLDLPGQIVADLKVVSDERRVGCARLRIEALTVET